MSYFKFFRPIYHPVAIRLITDDFNSIDRYKIVKEEEKYDPEMILASDM